MSPPLTIGYFSIELSGTIRVPDSALFSYCYYRALTLLISNTSLSPFNTHSTPSTAFRPHPFCTYVEHYSSMSEITLVLYQLVLKLLKLGCIVKLDNDINHHLISIITSILT